MGLPSGRLDDFGLAEKSAGRLAHHGTTQARRVKGQQIRVDSWTVSAALVGLMVPVCLARGYSGILLRYWTERSACYGGHG